MNDAVDVLKEMNSGTEKPCRPSVLLLTGGHQAGKTAVCRRFARLAVGRGWRVAGVVSPALFKDGLKTGIQVTDLRSGATRFLAAVNRKPKPDQLGYLFDEDVIAWANAAIAASSHCDLLIVDELGPLELEQGRGFTSAFEVLRRRDYRLAVVVVRPGLVNAFESRIGLPFTTRIIEGVPYEVADLSDDSGDWVEEYLRG